MSETSVLDRRASGILLHPTSLPGPGEIGDLGPEAHRFLGALARAGQTWWQMLPIGPTHADGCPYVATSAFAANPLLISLETLAQDGLLRREEIPHALPTDPTRVDFDRARDKLLLLRHAYDAFRSGANPGLSREHDAFVHEQGFWLEDFALFSALRDLHKGAAWTDWPADVRSREPAALARARGELGVELGFHQFLQFAFDRQWRALRAEAERLGLLLMGDLPIFVAHDSADVWARPEIFKLAPDGKPIVVAGVPPDYFSETGQLWGNPLYRWDVLRSRGFDWWLDRLRSLLRRFDAVRIDHFIGFHRSWQIPTGSKDARVGQFEPGPAADFFHRVREAFGKLPIVAEDLGLITPEVWQLRDQFHLPGMRVLQFAFNPDWAENEHLPHTYQRNALTYTGTHDNDTTVGWWTKLEESTRASGPAGEQAKRSREFALSYLGATDGREIHWAMIRLAMGSGANLSIVPVQDVLGLGSEARMNVPGTAVGNWAWRLLPGAFNTAHEERLWVLSRTYCRTRGHR